MPTVRLAGALFLLLAFLLAAAGLGCESAGDAVQGARQVAGALATLSAPEAAAPGRATATPAAAAAAAATSNTGTGTGIGAGAGVAADPLTDVPLPAGARAALEALGGLAVAPRGSGIDYDRDDWRHWIDRDGDCQNTRAETLIAESRAPVSFAAREDNDRCRVIRGEWRGPWSGEIFTDAGDVDIDHHIPLAHVHESGGWQWSAGRKRAYANDLSNPASLQATKASLNREKGKQAPDQWRPPNRAAWCRYAADWIAVKSYWELTVTRDEVDALRDMLATCGAPGSWGLGSGEAR